MANIVSSSNVVSQLGQETSPGSLGSAGTKLKSLKVEPSDEQAIREVEGAGHRFDTDTVIDKSWTSFQTSEGVMTYAEHLYCLENIFGTTSVTLLGAATQKRVYDVALLGSITPKTWVHQWGDPADNVNIFGYGLLADYGEKFDRDAGASNSGVGIAQLITTGGTFTATPKVLLETPIGAADFNIYLDTTGAGLGGTQITDEINTVEWSIKGMKTERWAANRANPSYAGHLDTKPKTEVKFTIYESTAARPIIASLKTGARYFLRIDAQGPIIEAANHFMAQRDFCVKLMKHAPLKDTKGAYGRELTFVIVEDSTWGHAMMLTSQTKEATL
jgi:hypothetical protein